MADDGAGPALFGELAADPAPRVMAINCESAPENYLGPLKKNPPERLIVADAAEMAQSGAKADEIIRRLGETIPCVDASFVIDNLDYLRRGGRCSGLEAAGAKFLQLKPWALHQFCA